MFSRGRKTVASITASLSQMVEDLKAHADSKQAERDHHAALASDAALEHVKAKAAADKIAGLLS